jgi:adenosylcobinamide kinase / adenosylcobinamide-phosphate guanylyltransferase
MADQFRSLLVLGGARSGKSRYAQQVAERSGKRLIYVATGEAGDAEMAARIAAHRTARGPGWQTIEVPLALSEALFEVTSPDAIVLVDCLTLWLSNLMLGADDIAAESKRLGALISELAGSVILVSNEVGTGIVPENALARQFRDAQGRLNQLVAAACDMVVLVAAGLPVTLKPGSHKIPDL